MHKQWNCRMIRACNLLLTVAVPVVLLVAPVLVPAPVVQADIINVACDVSALIDVLNTANSNGEPDTLELATECTYTLTDWDNRIDDGQNGLPSITSEITINGNAATIQRDPSFSCLGADPDFRIFHVDSDGDLTLNDMTVSHGCATN